MGGYRGNWGKEIYGGEGYEIFTEEKSAYVVWCGLVQSCELFLCIVAFIRMEVM